MITLKLGSVQMELSDRLIWTDEYGYSPAVSSNRMGSTGALIIHTGKRQAGRPITLDGNASQAWISRADCDRLYAWCALAGAEFELVVRGTPRKVKFDNSQGAAFTATPLWQLLDSVHDGETVYLPTFKFIEI